ncbi:MAG TPA: phytochelatin synthase family protein [Prochlorococcus sp.]|nr:phytochelatin synthase family protein [Prochlorococcus sp.]
MVFKTNQQYKTAKHFSWITSPGIGLVGFALIVSPWPNPALAKNLVPITTSEGMVLLQRSKSVSDYASLMEAFLTQSNLAYCGVASAVMVLNSLAVPAPPVDGFRDYRFWTQDNIFTFKPSKSLISPAKVRRQGMTLQEVQSLLSHHGVSSKRLHGDILNLSAFRSLLKNSLDDSTDRLIVNYDRRFLGQKGGGHFSPLAAYDAITDKVLILDVARYRYPSVWVKTHDLWRAMRTLDGISGLQRGILTIE